MVARGIMEMITIPDDNAEDAADLRTLRAAKAEEGDAPTISMKEVAKLWGIAYIGDMKLVNDLKAGHEDIKAERVTFIQ